LDPKLAYDESIEGVVISPLKVIQDDRGAVMHMLRADSSLFTRFGEVYFSEVNPGVVKAWRRHREMTQHFAVPVGRVKFVMYDSRIDSSTQGSKAECVLGRPDAYGLLMVPPMVWYGFQGLAKGPSIVANCTDISHDPDEVERADDCPGLVGYVW